MPINPKQLLQAAMASGGAGGAPNDSMPIPGAASGAGGTAAGPQGGMQDALPSELAGAQPTGVENSGVLSPGGTQGVGNEQLAGQLVGGQDQTGQAVMQMIQAIQDPNTPPDQKAQLQAQLQLAALRALTAGPTGAAGMPRS